MLVLMDNLHVERIRNPAKEPMLELIHFIVHQRRRYAVRVTFVRTR